MPAAVPHHGSAARISEAAGQADLERQVRDALTHLHDPSHLQRHPLTRFVASEVGSRPSSAGQALRQALLDAVESLRPRPEASPSSLASRTYQILRLRYVEGLDIPQVMDRLALSRTVYYVGQQHAVEAVAVVLADRWRLAEGHDQPSETSAGPEARPEAERAPEVAASHSQTNLPSRLTTFVGRGREMAEVRRLLGIARLLTLTGAGGCGKSRLAVECARSLLDERPNAYADGVWLVALAGIAELELVPQAVAAAVGVREEAGSSLADRLARHLADARALIVLDNCDHLLDACAQLANSLLLGCPSLTILATSRQSLGVEGEMVWRVPSLAVPPPEPSPSIESLAAYESVQLFADRARLVATAFALAEHNVLAVADICRRLDGMPLAIELAAARVGALTPDQIASRLDHDFHLLTGGSRNLLPRQQTLEATLDWSYDLLDDQEAKLLRWLSVFAGGFTLEAAEAVCPGDGVEEAEVVALLTQLVDRSLVEAATAGASARYRLLEPIRQYAWHRLDESAELEVARPRHSRWCLEIARAAEREAEGPDSWRWLDLLEVEHDNLRAALGWCLEHDVEIGLEIASSLSWFWDARGHFREASYWTSELLSRSSEQTLTRARVLRTAGFMATGEGAWTNGVQMLEESVDICRTLGDGKGLGEALYCLGHILCYLGENARAEPVLEEALRVSREVGNQRLISDALWHLSGFAHYRGERDRARQMLEEALAIAREIGDPHAIAYRLFHIGWMELPNGDLVRARAVLEDALALFRSEGHAWGVGASLVVLGHLALSEGRLADARALFAESVEAAWRVAGAVEFVFYLALAAELEVRAGSHLRGARLFGAIEAECSRTGTALQPRLPDTYNSALSDARSTLGEEAFARAWADGQAMTIQQAVEYALQGEDAT